MTPAEALAVEHRLKAVRGSLRRALRDGEVTLASAFADPAAAGMRVLGLLTAQRSVGRTRAERAMRAARVVDPSAKLRELSLCQRLELIAAAKGAAA